jgi:outer membrane protein insertion porin family
VKIKHTSISRTARTLSPASRLAWRPVSVLGRVLLVLALAICASTVFAQASQTIEQIRVIGNRRIPKETILARLFTHVGDNYDPISVERDFNSLWNTSYFDDLRIEREDTEKGIILDIFVRRSQISARSTTRD